ncbi:MAG: hypothetical protein ACOX6I_01760 [Syntrophomonadaceae bacterium]|jgi:hypothetical protein
MNQRRVIYILALIVVAAVVYYSGNNQGIDIEPSISRQTILNDFKNLSDQKQELAFDDSYHTTDVFFPESFNGYKGDEFYITVQSQTNITTLKYIIQEKGGENEQGPRLEYKLKDTWDNFKPPQGKFETYHLQDNEWILEK